MKTKNFFKIIAFLLFFICFTGYAQQIIPIKYITLKADGESDFIILKNNGEVYVINLEGLTEKIGILNKNGKLMDNRGNLLAKIDKEGFVTDAKNAELVQIRENGDLDNGSGKLLSWTTDGKFFLQEEKFLQLDPIDKTMRKTASFLIFLMMSFN